MILELSHIAGVLFSLVLITGIIVLSCRQVENAKDFVLGGGKSSGFMVSGAIIGTLVGGASTIGTAQLAFSYGFSAIWFCLGAGLGCLVLGVFFVKPMRHSGYLTLQEMIRGEYGDKAGFLCSVLGTLGIFFNIIAQILSGRALLMTMFPISKILSAAFVAFLMIAFVVFGGMRGLGKVGAIKTVMLYICAIICVILVFNKSGGFDTIYHALPREKYFNLFARGIGIDAGAGLSLIVGVISTQTYAQSVLSAKSDRAAVQGTLLSSLLIPPIGLGSVFVGLYMRTIYPEMEASQVFPQFLLQNVPGFVAGIFLAVLLVTIIGCGAGLALGISSVIINNFGKESNEQKRLVQSRIIIVAVLSIAVIFTIGDLESIILQWSFMSMGLRGAVLFLPLIGALFLRGKIPATAVIISIIVGPLFVLFGKIGMNLPFDSLFLGLAMNVLILAMGLVYNQFAKKQ